MRACDRADCGDGEPTGHSREMRCVSPSRVWSVCLGLAVWSTDESCHLLHCERCREYERQVLLEIKARRSRGKSVGSGE